MDHKGKSAYVTGASKGIGYAIAAAMVDAGMNVTISARTPDDVRDAAAKLDERGAGRAHGVVCDVRDFDSQRAAVAEHVERFGGLDVVIANAGVGGHGPVDEITPEQWRATIDTNLTGVFYTVKAAVAELKKSEGYLFTIGSLAGVNYHAGMSAYNASKAGLLGFSHAVMLDLRKHGIKVTTIMPGSVATHFGGSEPGPGEEWKIQSEDLGEMVMYLLSVPARTLPSRVEVRPSQPPRK
jgi:NAD(P)-dependent dehydrogenase (short-subunit alcohol dehydrogenase family)